MIDFLIVFTSSMFSVFALGFQSLNVNQGQRVMASVTSLVICTGSLFLFKAMPTAGLWPILAYFLGCNVGIQLSMAIHPRVKAWLESRKTPKEIA